MGDSARCLSHPHVPHDAGAEELAGKDAVAETIVEEARLGRLGIR